MDKRLKPVAPEQSLQERQALGIELTKQWSQVGRSHAFCFSLHVMHTRVQGIAFNRASAIGSPQSRHTP